MLETDAAGLVLEDLPRARRGLERRELWFYGVPGSEGVGRKDRGVFVAHVAVRTDDFFRVRESGGFREHWLEIGGSEQEAESQEVLRVVLETEAFHEAGRGQSLGVRVRVRVREFVEPPGQPKTRVQKGLTRSRGSFWISLESLRGVLEDS